MKHIRYPGEKHQPQNPRLTKSHSYPMVVRDRLSSSLGMDLFWADAKLPAAVIEAVIGIGIASYQLLRS